MAVGEWDRRELCPDGSCVGVIGPDGHCKVCKRAVTNWGNERDRGLNADAEADADGDDDLEDDDDDDEYEDDDEGEDGDEDDDEDDDEDGIEDDPLDAIDPGAPAALGSAAEWNRRQVCPDGACIGVIDDEGNCKVCGKRAHGARTSGTSEKPRAVPKVVPAAAPPSPSEEVSTPTPSEEAQLVAAATDLAASLEEERKLCPDGACVGVIGADGKCKLCGKEAA